VGELISKITSCHVQVRSTWPLLQCAIDRPGTAYPHCLITRPIADGHDCIQNCFSFRNTSTASVMNTRDMQCSIARCRDASSALSEEGKGPSCSLCSVDTLPIEPRCHRRYAKFLPSRRTTVYWLLSSAVGAVFPPTHCPVHWNNPTASQNLFQKNNWLHCATVPVRLAEHDASVHAVLCSNLDRIAGDIPQ